MNPHDIDQSRAHLAALGLFGECSRCGRTIQEGICEHCSPDEWAAYRAELAAKQRVNTLVADYERAFGKPRIQARIRKALAAMNRDVDGFDTTHYPKGAPLLPGRAIYVLPDGTWTYSRREQARVGNGRVA